MAGVVGVVRFVVVPLPLPSWVGVGVWCGFRGWGRGVPFGVGWCGGLGHGVPLPSSLFLGGCGWVDGWGGWCCEVCGPLPFPLPS